VTPKTNFTTPGRVGGRLLGAHFVNVLDLGLADIDRCNKLGLALGEEGAQRTIFS